MQNGLCCGEKWGLLPEASRDGGAPPTPPPRLTIFWLFGRATCPMVFRGTFDYSLDAKNRLTVPARFRATLSDGVVLAKGLERCVALWTPSGYDAYSQSSLASFHPLSPSKSM